jgi:tRNA pseudouridine32 synthase / 23S rRNA pseudouridine746 synthase
MDYLYIDDDIVVVAKSSGLLAVPGKNDASSVVSLVQADFPHCIKNPEVHRLDMDTSGIMVLALHKDSQRHLSIQFQDRKIFKRYIALLNGKVTEKNGRIELKFRLDYDRRPLQVYDDSFGKLGVTDWQSLAIEGSQTRVEFFPITGRTHQLRVHAAHEKGLGCPIIGDTLYGGHPRHGELHLHAAELHFTHPSTGKKMEFHHPAWF